jgi:hypothetical protein
MPRGLLPTGIMADIFISYSKGQRAVTEDLARDLQAKGYSVWWDTALVSGENYRSVILAELAKARAVIVIWTQDSVKSGWVMSEATRARARGILLPFRDPDLEMDAVPPPFDTIHTDEVTNRPAIFSALARLGLTPNPSGAPDTSVAEAAAWNYAQQRNSVADFYAFLAAYPNGMHAKAAEAGLAKLRKSNPGGRWRMIGASLATMVLLVGAFFAGSLFSGAGPSLWRTAQESSKSGSQPDQRPLLVWLDSIQPSDKQCRLTFDVQNRSDDAIDSMKGDFIVLAANRQQLDRFIAELGPVRPRRSFIRTFALNFQCDQMAELRINDVVECSPPPMNRCLDMIGTSSRIEKIRFR